jgi:glucokinase
LSLAIGIDLGGTNMRAALVHTGADAGAANHELEEIKVALPSTAAATVADVVASAVTKLAAEPGATDCPVGIGVAAMLKGATGIVENSPNLGWRNVDFGGLLRARIPRHRVRLANDVGAITFGEYRFGAGRGTEHLLCIYAGTGIGGGVIAAGRLNTGASGIASEIGHTKVVRGPSARLCGCGQRGCIEAYAGGRKLAERAHEELAAGATSLAVELAGGDVAKVHAGHLDQAVARGDAYATALWDEIGPLFGAVVANAVTLLNPARVIFGGGVLWGAVELRRRVLAVYQELVNAPSGAVCHIVEAALGDRAGILGSASLAARG